MLRVIVVVVVVVTTGGTFYRSTRVARCGLSDKAGFVGPTSTAVELCCRFCR